MAAILHGRILPSTLLKDTSLTPRMNELTLQASIDQKQLKQCYLKAFNTVQFPRPSKISSLGMNIIRLKFAIEMIDDVLDNRGDVTVQDSVIRAHGTENGTALYDMMRTSNPWITNATTRLDVCILLQNIADD